MVSTFWLNSNGRSENSVPEESFRIENLKSCAQNELKSEDLQKIALEYRPDVNRARIKYQER